MPDKDDTSALRYFVGIDLGQTTDPTAIAVLERPRITARTPRHERRPDYALRHLQRFPLATPYTQVVEDVIKMLQTPPLPGCMVAVDQTGVGRPVVEMLARAMRGKVRCHLLPITITAGSKVSHGGDGSLHVSKQILVGHLQVLFQAQRLHIAKALPDAAVLVKELENFRVKITAGAKQEAYSAWREGDHDDLVLAAALAAYVGEETLPKPGDRPGRP